MSKPIRVFIIDDDVLLRFALSQLLSQEPDILVVGDAAANNELKTFVSRSKPDILIFDVPLPPETGFKFLKQICSFRLPAIAFTKTDDNLTKYLIPLLEVGFVDFVQKPETDQMLPRIREQLVHVIKKHTNTLARKKAVDAVPRSTGVSFLDPLKALAIGSSTGGPEALANIIPQLPESIAFGVAIVQHMPAGFTAKFSARLNSLSQVNVKEAAEGDILKKGTVLIAPGDFHMTFVQKMDGNRRLAQVHLTQDPPQWNLRPTVDAMMTTLAPIYGRNLLGVILTGMGTDGVVGMRQIKHEGGRTLVQNKETSVVYGMGQEVVKNNLADEVLPLDEIIPKALEVLS